RYCGGIRSLSRRHLTTGTSASTGAGPNSDAPEQTPHRIAPQALACTKDRVPHYHAIRIVQFGKKPRNVDSSLRRAEALNGDLECVPYSARKRLFRPKGAARLSRAVHQSTHLQ